MVAKYWFETNSHRVPVDIRCGHPNSRVTAIAVLEDGGLGHCSMFAKRGDGGNTLAGSAAPFARANGPDPFAGVEWFNGGVAERSTMSAGGMPNLLLTTHSPGPEIGVAFDQGVHIASCAVTRAALAAAYGSEKGPKITPLRRKPRCPPPARAPARSMLRSYHEEWTLHQ